MGLVNALTYHLDTCEEIHSFWALLDTGQDATCAVAQSARAFMVAARFVRTPQPSLVVLASEDAANSFARNLATYVGEENVLRFPARSDFPFSNQGPDAAIVGQRMQALHALHAGYDKLVVCSSRALLQKMPPVGTDIELPISLDARAEEATYNQQVLGYDEVRYTLERLGYVNTASLEGPGSFCAQGGSIDVFAGNMGFPLRLDFFGDGLEDIRRIVPSTGQTIASLETCAIHAVRELLPSKRSIGRAKDILHNPAKTNPTLRTLLEQLEGGLEQQSYYALLPYLYEKLVQVGNYLGPDCQTVLIEPRALLDDALHASEHLAAKYVGTGFAYSNYCIQATDIDFGGQQQCLYQSVLSVGVKPNIELAVKRSNIAGDSEKLFGRVRSFMDAGMVVLLCAPNYAARKDLMLELVDLGLPIQEVAYEQENLAGPLQPGIVYVCALDVSVGFVLPAAKLAVLSLAERGRGAAFKPASKIDITQITFPFAPGDYVVHAAHGVAYFNSLVRREIDGVARDYLLLEYAEEDKLYVPVEQLDRVTRYVGPEGSNPRLTRLNTSDWSRALKTAGRATRKLAFDLVDVYARRASIKGYAFSPDTPWQKQMEDDFPYVETPDQLAAIAEVKADMQSRRPMDRLVCGDVGFGKTEVALRAAFKATQDKKQVMVLCPTTILAQQHYTTFCERFSPYGVRVEVLSRFRSAAQQEEALGGFANGSVEVLVGTHRLLSHDVNPHDLGLVIIDEEQRFGVGHKEQLKHLRESIDVLTLSATPIPRTMQMSLSGVRDMSLILTPPDDRLPVEVYVGEWDPDLVSDAIARELVRRGQVYYVSNRVRSIEEAVQRVQDAAPSARIGVAHGQLSKDALEQVMEDFSAGAIDVLVATTIIESGIDNPHTNTLIIENSQRLGLAQMYQLKGRVGRSARQAYAYFMFPEHIPLTEEAMARLTAINEHQDLGSGMRVAMRDLEIRGAGTLLGAEQSGNISAVGFDLFASMLAEAVNNAREGKTEQDTSLPPALSDITVNIAQSAYLPDDYIENVDQRVLYYRKIASCASLEEAGNLETEVVGHFGALPPVAMNLFAKTRIKALAFELGLRNVHVSAGKLHLEPIPKLPASFLKQLAPMKARYIAQSSKLQIPVKYLVQDEEESMFDVVFALLNLLRDALK